MPDNKTNNLSPLDVKLAEKSLDIANQKKLDEQVNLNRANTLNILKEQGSRLANEYQFTTALGISETKAVKDITDYGSQAGDDQFEITPNTTQEELNTLRDVNQGFWESTGNAVAGGIAMVLPKLAEMTAGVMLDEEDFNNKSNDYWKEKIESMKDVSSDISNYYDIHGAEAENGTFTNGDWIAKNLIQEGGAFLGAAALGSYVMGAGLGVLSSGVTSLLRTTASGLINAGKAAAAAGESSALFDAGVNISKVLPTIKRTMEGAKTLSIAYGQTNMEGALIGYDVASQVYKEKYKEFLVNKGFISPDDDITSVDLPSDIKASANEYANNIASNAGSTAYNLNKFNMIFNLTGAKYFVKGANSTTKAVEHTILRNTGRMLSETAQEGAEELMGGVAEVLAKRQAKENLTSKEGGVFGKHTSLGADVYNYIFSEEGAETFLSGAAMGAVFGAIGEGKGIMSGEYKKDNIQAKLQQDQIADGNTLGEVYNQLGELDGKSKVIKMVNELGKLTHSQDTLFPEISEAYLTDNTVKADALRAKALQYQAYQYFQEGLGDTLINTFDLLSQDKENAEKTFGKDYQSRIAEAKKLVKEAQDVYDTYSSEVHPALQHVAYQNVLNRDNLIKAINSTKEDLAKARVKHIQVLAALTVDPLTIHEIGDEVTSLAKEQKLKQDYETSNPLTLQEVQKHETRGIELSEQLAKNLKQHSEIISGEYLTNSIKAKEEVVKKAEQVKEQEIKKVKSTEALLNNKAQKFANEINSIDEIESVSALLDDEIASANASGDTAKVEELTAQKEQVIAKVTELVTKKNLKAPVTPVPVETPVSTKTTPSSITEIEKFNAVLQKRKKETKQKLFDLISKYNNYKTKIVRLQQLITEDNKRIEEETKGILTTNKEINLQLIIELKSNIEHNTKILAELSGLTSDMMNDINELKTLKEDIQRQLAFNKQYAKDNKDFNQDTIVESIINEEDNITKIDKLINDIQNLITKVSKAINTIVKSVNKLFSSYSNNTDQLKEIESLIIAMDNINKQLLEVKDLSKSKKLIAELRIITANINKAQKNLDLKLNKKMEDASLNEAEQSKLKQDLIKAQKERTEIYNRLRYLTQLLDVIPPQVNEIINKPDIVVKAIESIDTVNTNLIEKKVNVDIKPEPIEKQKVVPSVSGQTDNKMIAELNEAIREAQQDQNYALANKLKAQREKLLADLALKKPNGNIEEEIKTEEETVVIPEFKLVHIPSKIAAPTVKSFNEVHSGEAYNKGSEVLGEGLSPEQKEIANNILDNGPDSIQFGTKLRVSPIEFEGERGYAFTTEDGRVVGYLHKPSYIRPERLAESQHDTIESQKAELQGIWDNLNSHFDGPNPLPFLASTVTNKTAGFINQGETTKLIAQDILTDENTVIVAVQAKGKVSIANQDIVEYLRVYLGGVISEGDMKAIKEMPANTHLILVPTSVKVGDKVQYTYAYLNKTSLSENAEVSKIVTDLLTKYLNGEALSPDEKAFVVNVLAVDTELTTSKARKPKVKIGGGEAVTIEQLNDLLKVNEKVSIQIPFGFTHNSKISLNGSEVSIKELIGSSFKTNLLGYDLNTGEKGYTHNPILSFGPIDTAKLNPVISQPTDTEEVSKPSDELVDDKTANSNTVSDMEDDFLLSPIENSQPTSSIEKLMNTGSKEDKKKYNILKRQQIAKVLRNIIFNTINKKPNLTVSEILRDLKQACVNKTRFFNDAVAKGETGNQEYADNFKFLTDNFNTFSKEAIKMLKEMGYVVNKTSSKIEEKPVDKDKVEGDIINNDVDATTDSEALNEKEGEHTQKIDVLAFSESPYAVSSSYVKMFLETISSGAKGVLGGSELYGGKKLYGELLNAFADKNFTQEDFIQILNASTKPHFKDLAAKFEALEQHFKNQILVSLSTTKGNFVGLNNDKVFNSNRNTRDVILRNTILNTLTSKLLTEGTDKQLNTLTSDGQILVDFLKTFSDRDRKDDLSDMTTRHILDSLGLSVTQAQLDMFKGADETAFTVELVSSVLSTIEQALKLNNFKRVELGASLNNILIGSELHGRHLENFIIESEGDSIIDVNGKKRFPFGVQHSTAKIWNNLTSAKRITDAKRLVNVYFTSANTWLKTVINGGVMPKLIYLDGSYGESFGDLDFKNKLKARFEFFKNVVENKNNTYSFFSSAKSDKHLIIGADAPKILTNQKRHIFDIILAEAKRIKQYNEALKNTKSKSIESIEGFDGSKFYLFPELNNKSLSNVWVEGEINEALFSGQVDNAVIEQLADLVFLPIANEIKANLQEVLGDEVRPFDFTKDKDIRDFAVSEIVNNYNFQSLVSGDPAFFAKKSVEGSLANLFKRLTRDIATAKRVVNVKPTIKTICITEPSGEENNTSKNIEQLEAILGEQRTPKLNKDGSPKLDKNGNPEYDNFGYRNIDLADAQGYCTVKEYATLLLGNGEINQAQYDTIINEWDNHFRDGGTVDTMAFSSNAMTFLFKPRKPVTIGNHLEKPNGFDTEISRPIYIKYSIFPLIPELLDKNNTLMSLAGLMQKHGIDRAVTKTGFKVGSPKTVNIENITDDLVIDDTNSIELDREMDGNQLDIPYDETKDEVLQGTQPMKLIFDGIDEKELKDKFEGLQKELIDEQYTEYIALLGLKTDANGALSVSDFSKFKSYLEKALSDTLENPNEEEVFDLNFDKTGFKHPLFFNKFGPKIETVLIQGFKKHVLKTKLGGKSYVLTSEYGFKGTSKLIKKTPSYNEEKGLLPQRLINAKGEIATAKEVSDYFAKPTEENKLTVAPAQVMVAWNFLDNKGEPIPMEDFLNEKGELDMNRIPKELLEGFAYRIPTQGHNSMSSVEIVGFLPSYMGDTIIASKDWVTQMGSDFDIDKVFMHKRLTDYSNGKLSSVREKGDVKTIKNDIVDTYMKVLQKPETFKRMIQPLGFGKLPDVVEKLKQHPDFQDTTTSILSPVTQNTNYENGTAGKLGIGLSSLISVFTSIVQGKGLKTSMMFPIVINGVQKWAGDLSGANQLFNPEVSKNSTVSAFQSASTDNIKELLVKTANYTDKTNPLLMAMGLLGLDEEFITYMMVFKHNTTPRKQIGINLAAYPLSLEMLQDSVLRVRDSKIPLTANEILQDEIITYYYNNFLTLGEELDNVSKIINTTTNGFGAYIEDVDILKETALEISKATLLDKQGVSTILSDKLWGSGYKYLKQVDSLIASLYPTSAPVYTKVMSKALSLVKHPTKKYRKAIKNFMKSYFFSSSDIFNGNVEKTRQRLLIGDKSLAHRLVALKKIYPDNSFLKSLTFTFGGKGRPNLVNYVGKTLTPSEKYLWQEELKELYTSIDSDIAKDFIIYQYAVGGVQVPNSAISMLPYDLIDEMGISEDMYKVSMVEDPNNKMSVVDSIVMQFLQNNVKAVSKFNEDLNNFVAEDAYKFSYAPLDVEELSQLKPLNSETLVTENLELHNSKPLIKVNGDVYIYSHSNTTISTYRKINPVGMFGMTETNSTSLTATSATKLIKQSNLSKDLFKKDTERLGDVLMSYFGTNRNKNYETLIRGLNSAIKKFNPEFNMYIPITRVENLMVNGVKVEGSYNGKTIQINSSLSNEDFERTLIHETLHHLLRNIIHAENLPASIKKSIVKLERLMEVAKTEADKGGYTGRKNAFLNLDEFINEMLTSKATQEWANNIPFNNATLLDRFKDLVINVYNSFMEVMGISLVEVEEGSLLEQVLTETLFLKDAISGKKEVSLATMPSTPAKLTSSTQPSTTSIVTEPKNISANNTVTYTPKGKETQTYTIKGNQIFNKNNEEVFKEDSVDRNKIFANLAIKQNRAVIVKYKDADYIVNNKEVIISGVTGNIMKWGAENGDRKAILALAKEKLDVTKTEKMIPVISATSVTPQAQPVTSEEAIIAKYAPLIKQASLNDDRDGYDELAKARNAEINELLNPKSIKPSGLAIDETNVLPNLPKYELFPNVYANKGQREAIDKIENFLSPSNKEQAFMLNGKGGTGKTTIIKKAIVNKSGIMALAPSHKAKKVLGKSLNGVTGNVKTLASALGIKLNESTGEFTADEYARKKGIPLQKALIIVIDESSMVSDKMYDEIMKLKQPFAKVIFMGDKAQLPPVGQEKDSKVFDIENSYELTEKMRQAKTSPIINIGSMIAANVETTAENRILNIIKPEDRINKYDAVSGSSLQWIKETDKAIDSFVKDFKEGNGNPDHVKIVTFNNELHDSEQSVKNLNIKVRDKLFGSNKKQYETGELLTAYDTFMIDVGGDQDDAAFHNSDDLIVLGSEEVKNSTGSVRVHSMAKGYRTFNFEYDITHLDLELDGEKLKFQIPVISESSLVKYKQDLSNLFKTDMQLAYALSKNFANLQYGYAITSHKSQGSTYKNVYVMEDNILGPSNGGSIKSKMQSLYVAVSRPTTNLYMVSYKNPDIQASPKEDNAISDEEILNSEKFITFMKEQKESQYSGISEQEMLDYFRNCKM